MSLRIGLCIAEVSNAGGTNRVVVNLANSFVKNNIDVTIFSINSTVGKPYYSLHDKVHINYLGVKLHKNVLLRSVFSFLNTVKALKKAVPNIDVLIATDPITCFAFSFLKTKFPDKKFIACEHMGIEVAGKHSLIARRLFYKKLDAVTVLNERDKLLLEQQGIKMKSCFVIPNEVSFYPEESADCTVKKMITVGRLVPQKGYDILVEILKDVMPRHKDWLVEIIGNGEMKEALQEKIDAYDLQKQVILMPPTQNIINAYLSASAYLMPSRYEGFPMVLLEAKACGLPCIAFDCPAGPAEIIEKNDGFLVPLYNEIEFGNAMEKLMNNETLRIEMGAHAKHNVLKYNSDAIYKKWQQLFEAIA